MALKTSVITYRIRGPYSIFNNVNSVEFINEFNERYLLKN